MAEGKSIRKVFSKVELSQIRPEIMTSGDGIIDVHVDTPTLPAGRYYVVEVHDDYVVGELREEGE